MAAVPAIYQRRVLFWGILGALVMRGVMIVLGARLIAEFGWVLYAFGAFLILTAVKMLLIDTQKWDPRTNVVVRVTRRLFPVTKRYYGQHFVVRRRGGSLLLTPLALALIMVEKH